MLLNHSHRRHFYVSTAAMITWTCQLC